MRVRGILLLVALLVGPFSAGCRQTGYRITPIPLDERLEETTVSGDTGWGVKDKIVLLDVSGILINGKPGLLLKADENPMAAFAEKLEKAANDPHVGAVVLRINSPGGGVAASDMMYQEILRFKKNGGGKGKPVVAVMMDVAASGGYYIACAADEIIAARSTVTGSIGVIMQMFNIEQTLTVIGVKTDAIKSGPNKDAGSPLRAMKDQEREIFQEIVDEFYKQFLDVVAAGRPDLKPDEISDLADGRVYTGKQALDLGLVDRLGTVRDAVAVAKKRAKLDKARVVMYHRPLAHRGTVYAQSPGGAPTVNLLNVNLPDLLMRSTLRFLYLWAPGP